MSVDPEVAVHDALATLFPGVGESQLEHNVVQAALQRAKQVHAGNTGGIERLGHVAAELAFHDAIYVLGLLLFTQVNCVVRGPSAAAGHVTGRVAALLKGTFGRETLVALQE
jgi:hypothetical protein